MPCFREKKIDRVHNSASFAADTVKLVKGLYNILLCSHSREGKCYLHRMAVATVEVPAHHGRSVVNLELTGYLLNTLNCKT